MSQAASGGPSPAQQKVTEAPSLLEAAAQLDKSIGAAVPKLEKEERSALERFIGELLRGEKFVDRNLVRAVKKRIADIDESMQAQINAILHHKDFLAIEGTWRGLKHMVSGVEAGTHIKINVLDATKDELADMFDDFEGSMWDQSPLYKQIYEAGYGRPGGHPVGALVGDFEFAHGPTDMKVLRGLGQLAAAAHAPFMASVSPTLFKMKSWTQVNDRQDIAAGMDREEYAAWNSFRETEDAKYVALTMPRFLSRLSYGEKKQKVKGFAFEEDTSAADHEKFCWSNSAWAFGRKVLESFDNYGWCTQICGRQTGGVVAELPNDLFEGADGKLTPKIPTEVTIPDKLERRLSLGDEKLPGGMGLVPLSHYHLSDQAVFFGAQSLHKPKTFVGDPYSTSNSRLGAQLPNIFACSRFAHYLKAMVRDKIGGFATAESLHNYLYEWISAYVEPNPNAVSDEQKAQRPLAEADVEVEAIPGQPGAFFAKFKLKPHYKLQTLDVAMSLVSSVKPAAG